MKTLLFTALLSLSTQAFATGGINCEIDDANLRASFGGVLSHGIPGSPFQVRGDLTLRKKFLSEEIPTQKVERFAQYFADGDEMKAMLYFEPTEVSKHMTMKLTLITKFNEKSYEYEGSYRLNLFEVDGPSVVRKGKVSCAVE